MWYSDDICCFSQLVYKVKMNVVLEKLIFASGSDQSHEWAELIEEAKTNLMKIMVMLQHWHMICLEVWHKVISNVQQDEQFVVEYCLTASWPTLSIAEEMLNYVSNRFPCSQVQIAMAKLATFSSMYGPNSFEYVPHLLIWSEHCNYILYI